MSLTPEEVTYLLNLPDSDACPRAVRWAWFRIPKRYWDEDLGKYIQITKISAMVFQYLHRHVDEYYKFLKEHKLKKNVYDSFISKMEKEPRTTWEI